MRPLIRKQIWRCCSGNAKLNVVGHMEEQIKKDIRALLINKEVYEKDLRDGIEEFFVPRKCLIFSIPLPFQIAFKDGTKFYTASKDIATFFAFNKYPVEMPMPYTIDDGHLRTFLHTRAELGVVVGNGSRVEDVTTISDLSEEKYQYVYEHCHHLVTRLNDIVYSYRMHVEDSRAHPVHLEQYYMVHTSIIDLPDWRVMDQGPLIVNSNPTNYEDIMFNLPEGLANAIGCFGLKINFGPGRLSAAIKFYADARRHLYRGDYRETLIFLGLCSESYLNGLYWYVLESEGMDEKSILDMIECTPFMSRIKKTLCQKVGGNWDLDDYKGPVGLWNKVVYQIRGRVVHAGYLPNVMEAWAAFEAVSTLDDFLRSNIERKKTQLPSAYAELSDLPRLFVHGEDGDVTFDVS